MAKFFRITANNVAEIEQAIDSELAINNTIPKDLMDILTILYVINKRKELGITQTGVEAQIAKKSISEEKRLLEKYSAYFAHIDKILLQDKADQNAAFLTEDDRTIGSF